jgi:hypothetical protein
MGRELSKTKIVRFEPLNQRKRKALRYTRRGNNVSLSFVPRPLERERVADLSRHSEATADRPGDGQGENQLAGVRTDFFLSPDHFRFMRRTGVRCASHHLQVHGDRPKKISVNSKLPAPKAPPDLNVEC